MKKRIAILIAAALITAVTVAGVALTVRALYPYWIFFEVVDPLSGGERELVAKSVSPNGRWKVRVFYVNPGAMASASYHVEVVDLRDGGSPRDIYFTWSDEGDPSRNIKWKNSYTVILDGQAIDVRNSDKPWFKRLF